MRRILLAASAFALVGASTAMADVGDSASIEINAEQEKVCEITDVSSSITLGAVNVAVAGTFKYKCNFEGDPELTFTSANGGVETTENGGATANYGIFLNDLTPAAAGFPTPNTWLQASNTPQSYPNITTSSPPNTEIVPYFYVGLTQALPVAGTYTDTLTIDIVP